jgi:polyphosphate kinase 2 (PPK2 family)
MGFCSDEEYREFLESCPLFERMLVRSGEFLLLVHTSPAPERTPFAVVAITSVTRTSQARNWNALAESASFHSVAGIILLKYWVSVSPDEQEKRFKVRFRASAAYRLAVVAAMSLCYLQ